MSAAGPRLVDNCTYQEVKFKVGVNVKNIYLYATHVTFQFKTQIHISDMGLTILKSFDASSKVSCVIYNSMDHYKDNTIDRPHKTSRIKHLAIDHSISIYPNSKNV